MQHTRREFCKHTGGTGLWAVFTAIGLLKPDVASTVAWDQAAFASKSVDEAFTALGVTGVLEHTQITMVAPDIVENGAIVPLSVVSKLPRTESIALCIEKNTNILAAHFTFPEGTLPEVQTRVKMAQTSYVFVLVKADGAFYYTKKDIVVIQGGCGD
jgi:sulfur-oxidizing protein SoxY